MLRPLLDQEFWPAAHPSRLLRPGCTTVTVLDDYAPLAILRWWVADATQWFEPWPGSVDTALWPSFTVAGDATASHAEVWFESLRLDGQDDLRARATVHADGPTVWTAAPPEGLNGVVVRALAEAIQQHLGDVDVPPLAEGEVLAMPGTAITGGHDDLRPRSWHAKLGGTMLRALELTPLRDEDDELVARRAQVHRAGSPHAAPRLLVWDGSDVRYWPGGSHPTVTPPQDREQWTKAEGLLLDRLTADWLSGGWAELS